MSSKDYHILALFPYSRWPGWDLQKHLCERSMAESTEPSRELSQHPTKEHCAAEKGSQHCDCDSSGCMMTWVEGGERFVGSVKFL